MYIAVIISIFFIYFQQLNLGFLQNHWNIVKILKRLNF